MDIADASFWIDYLKLLPQPEGGYYKEVFRSEIPVITPLAAVRQACTSIYYLLEGKDFSAFHRLRSDEIWYFHKGVALHLHVIDEQGNYMVHELADNYSGNLCVAIKAGEWFAASIPKGAGFTLVSCAVAPGFEFSEFEMADKGKLSMLYPQHKEIISNYCR